MNFGQLLKHYIDNSDKSIRLFSEMTDLNRGFLYNIFSGKKKLPEDKFHKILNSFPFSNTQKEALNNAFYEDIYGIHDYNKIQYIISELKALKDFDNDKYFFAKSSEEYDKETEYIKGKKNIINAIMYLLTNSISSETPLIYSNYEFSQTEIDSIIYSYILENKNVNLKHIINFNMSGIDTHNLTNIFQAIKYARKQINTYYYYGNKEIFSDNLFPFFIITTAGVLLYDTTHYNALLISTPSVIASFIASTEGIINNCTPLVLFPNNVFELKQCLSSSSFVGSISSKPCITPFLNLEMYQELAIDELPDKNFVINSLYNWYNAKNYVEPVPYIHLNTSEGFKDFAQKGIVSYFPKEYANPLSIENRIKVLEKCLTDNEKYHNFYLADDNKISFPDYINLDFSSNNEIVIYGSFDSPNHSYMGEFLIQFSNNIIFSDFNNFKNYAIRNHLYANDIFTDLFIKNLILELETKK